jgi:predicted acyltransferase
MIFVNDLSGDHVPAWMRHFGPGNGMTFVDLVFPAFLFIVDMSIPIALRSRHNRGQRIWTIVCHVLLRTVCLLFVGVMMVNAESAPNSRRMGWNGTLWTWLLFLSAKLFTVPRL